MQTNEIPAFDVTDNETGCSRRMSPTRRWCISAEMERRVEERGKRLEIMYFFYTTCPRCAKHCGKNYVIGVAKVQ